MASETTVGSIVGYLRLDTTDWDAHIAAAQAAAAELGNTDPNVHVDVNSGEAIAQLQAIRVATESTAASMDDLGNSSNHAGQQGSHGMMGLLKALIPIAPALVPLGAAAVGAGVAFGGLGAAGVLAFLGIKNAMEQGTVIGQHFQSEVDSMKTGLQVLEGIAARNVLAGFDQGVQSVNQHMPFLSTEIDHLSTYLGGALSSAVDGVLNLMVRLSPVFDMVGRAVAGVAAQFDAWSKSAGASDFVSYLLQALPQAGQLLSGLATTVSHLVQAFAPLGSTVMAGLSGVIGLLNAIPQGTLTVLASGALAVYTAFALWRGLTGIASSLSGMLATLAARMESTALTGAALALSSTALKVSLGGALGVLAIGAVAWSIWKQHQQAAEQQQRQLTDAIKQDNGAIGENTNKLLAQQLVQDGTIQKATQMGVSQKQLTAYLKGQPGAWDAINGALVKNASVTVSANKAQSEMGTGQRQLSSGAKDFESKLKSLRGQLVKGQASVKAQKLAYQLLSGQVKNTSGSLSNMQLATMDATTATKAQKTAINQLNQALDAELGKQLALSGSITAYDSARNTLIATLKKDTSTTNGNTAAGVRNRQNIESAVGALQRHRDVQIKNGDSTRQATLKYQANGAELLRQIAKTDGASSSTYKYTAKLLAIPKDVKTLIAQPGMSKAKVEADSLRQKVNNIPGYKGVTVHVSNSQALNGLASIQAYLRAIHSKSITVSVVRQYSNLQKLRSIPGMPNADGNVIAHAYASGGFSENHVAQIATTGTRIWAEPETGGEAYIPLSPSKRPRSEAILQEVATQFNMHLSKDGSGGAGGVVVASGGLSDNDIRRLGDYIGAQVYAGAYSGTAQHGSDMALAQRVAVRSVQNSGMVTC